MPLLSLLTMSSLAATQADGYYLPPEYFEGGAYKKQSKNAFDASQNNKSKPGHNQWLQRSVVRFELPYKGVCEGLNCPQPSIMRGTRYNAKKITTQEKYFSTPIYEFQMNCRLCQHAWVIRTNPKERGFDYVSGIHVQAGQESIVENIVGVSGEADERNDVLERLESTAHGKRRAMTEMEELQRIQKLNESSLNDADHNAMIRKEFRKDRKAKRKRQEHATQLGWRKDMEMLSEDAPLDVVASKEATYGNPKSKEQKRLRTVRTSSIFSSAIASKTSKRRRRKLSRQQLSSDTPPSPVRFTKSASTERRVKVEEVSSSNDTTTTKTKKRLKIGQSMGGVVVERTAPKYRIESSDTKEAREVAGAVASSLSEMLAAYESSDDENF